MPTRGACPGRAQPPAACARSTADAPRRPRAWSWPARRLFFPPLPICPSAIAPMALTHLIFQLIRCRRFAASAPPLALDRGLRAWAGGGEVRGGAGRGWLGPVRLRVGEQGGGLGLGPVPTPHAPIAWSYHLGAWDGVGTTRTTQSGRYGPEKLSRAACATELRWGRQTATGPKKGSIKKHVPKISRRGKTNHSDWNAQEISVENPTSEMAPPWKLKKDDRDNLSTAM
jgi:hypothetical protein